MSNDEQREVSALEDEVEDAAWCRARDQTSVERAALDADAEGSFGVLVGTLVPAPRP